MGKPVDRIPPIPTVAYFSLVYTEISYVAVLAVMSSYLTYKHTKGAKKITETAVFNISHTAYCLLSVARLSLESRGRASASALSCQELKLYLLVAFPHFVALGIMSAVFFNHW